MAIKLLLFGLLAEKAGFEETQIKDISSKEDLNAYLAKSAPELQNLTYSMAINGVIQTGEFELKGDEEVALLPPFSGG